MLLFHLLIIYTAIGIKSIFGEFIMKLEWKCNKKEFKQMRFHRNDFILCVFIHDFILIEQQLVNLLDLHQIDHQNTMTFA